VHTAFFCSGSGLRSIDLDVFIGWILTELAPLAPYGACSLRGILVRLRAAKRASENLEVASLVPELVLP